MAGDYLYCLSIRQFPVRFGYLCKCLTEFDPTSNKIQLLKRVINDWFKSNFKKPNRGGWKKLRYKSKENQKNEPRVWSEKIK